MTEEQKQEIVDQVVIQKGLNEDTVEYQNLQSIVTEDITGSTFFAKVYAIIEVIDLVHTYEPTRQDWLENIGRAAQGAMGTYTPANRNLSAFYNAVSSVNENWQEDEVLAQNVYQGLDVAEGLKGGKDPENYYKWLNDVLAETIDQTGILGVVVQPARGEGGKIYMSEELDEWLRNNPPSLYATGGSFYGTENPYRKYPGTKQNAPKVITRPTMTAHEEIDEKWEHTGAFNETIAKYNEEGAFLTKEQTGDGGSIAVLTKLADGSIEVSVKEVSQDEYENVEQEVYLNPNKQIIDLTESDELNEDIIENAKMEFGSGGIGMAPYDVFGDITPDYTIFKRPDLATVFDEGMTSNEAIESARPTEMVAGNIPEELFYGNLDHVSGTGPSFNDTQKISWISLAPQEMKAVQVDLMQAGLLSPESFFLEQGSWGTNTENAMYTAMVGANRMFTDVGTYIQQEKEDYFNKPPITPRVYINPSPETIKTQVDSALKSIGITRKLTDAEMVAFADYYSQADRDYETATAEYTKNLDLAKRLFPGAPDEVTLPTTPGQSLSSYMEEEFEPQLAAQARAKQEKNDLSYLFSSLDQFDRMIEG
tara:strand:- start:219 stop:1997 length:1779 start_codon:yes stop_codon:yes gene_type:complete